MNEEDKGIAIIIILVVVVFSTITIGSYLHIF